MLYRSAFAFVVVITAALPAAAQVSVSMHSGIEIHMTARIEPGSVRIPSGVRAIHIGRFHRVVQDRSEKRYFAYDVLVEPRKDSRAFQVRLEPLSLSASELTEMVDLRPGHMFRLSSTPWCRMCARETAWRSISWRIPQPDRKSWTISSLDVRTPRLPRNPAQCETCRWLTWNCGWTICASA